MTTDMSDLEKFKRLFDEVGLVYQEKINDYGEYYPSSITIELSEHEIRKAFGYYEGGFIFDLDGKFRNIEFRK